MYVLVILIIKRIQFYKINHVQETVVDIISKLVEPQIGLLYINKYQSKILYLHYLVREVFIDNKQVKQQVPSLKFK